MKIQTVKIDTVLLDPANVRRHPARNLETIKASLTRYGQQVPIVVDTDGICRKGNGTLQAARDLGWDSIKIIRTVLKGSEATGFSIADNRSSELASWDETGLAEQLRALQSEDFDLAAVGFDEAEVDKLIEQLGTEAISNSIDDAVPPEDFPEKDESIETDYCCPKCGYKWSGKQA